MVSISLNKTPIEKLIIFLVLVILSLLAGPAMAVDELFMTRSKADAAYDSGRYGEAADEYEQWLKNNKNDHEAWYRLGNAYSKLIRPVAALSAYRKAQKIKPEDPRPWHNMGMLYMRMAVESYDGLRRNVPKDDPLVPYSEKVLSGILELISIRLQGGSDPLKELAPLVDSPTGNK